jgi:CRISPR/Cas system CSM-associated protein Csm5 (group 7 of RAMP superfamily)
MTYEEFLNIPGGVLKDLQTILILKSKYNMDTTSEEREIWEHMKRFAEEQSKSADLRMLKQQLEELFKK